MNIPNPSIPDAGIALLAFLRAVSSQVNAITTGRASAFHGALPAAPTTGAWALGDEVRNVAPAELGSPGSKYVVHGWQCIAPGTPGTWVEMRYLTGN